MYPNIELIMNPSIAPIYVTTTNIIIPAITIANTALSNFIINFVSNAAINIRNLIIFVMPYIKAFVSDSYKLFITGILFITIGLMFADKIEIIDILRKLNKRIEELEHQVNHIKKTERMRENDWDLLMHSYSSSFKQLQDDFDKKYTIYDKQFKKMDKELKMYQ